MKKKFRFVIVCLIIAVLSIISPLPDVTAYADESRELYPNSMTEEEKLEESKVKESYQSDGGRTLSAPRIVRDSSMVAGQKVTWDCVWFGSYPQSEVDGPIYGTLKNASGWNSNNEIVVNGSRYRRIKKADATYAVSGNNYRYNWSDENTYHYFKYEPIKWRVLKRNGNQVLLLSDIALDDQNYNKGKTATWKTSTIRSWLNGYSASSNQQDINYSGKNFINSAFTSSEQSAIVNTAVINANNIKYGVAGGNNTTDKIFLLSESEVYGSSAVSYGFVSGVMVSDEGRRCKHSDYAKAMGVWSNPNGGYKNVCDWWLRSPGKGSDSAAYVSYYGFASSEGHGFSDCTPGIRVALNLNLSSGLWSDAGTACSKEGEEFFRVSYNANGGTGAPDSQIKKSGATLTLHGTKPVRAGYTFLGWSKNSAAAKASYKAGGGYTGNDNAVLYAVWKKESGSMASGKKNQKIKTTSNSYTKAYGTKAFFIGAKASGGGKLMYSSSNSRAVSVSSKGKVTIKGYGTAKITIKAAATKNYKSAVKKITIKVVPKKIELRLVKSPSKKKIKISWKKDKDVTGYEIYVSPRKDFKRETIKRAYKKNVSSKTIIGWKSKKTYYVKIRAYKKVGKTTYYGAWSKVRKVKVK